MKTQSVQLFKGVKENKAQVTADSIITMIKEGEADPLYSAIMLKKFAKIFEVVTKDKETSEIIMNAFQNSIEKGKTVEIHNAKVTVASKGYWDYSNTEDPYLDKLESIAKDIAELIKDRKNELEAKAAAWDKQNSPSSIQQFGIRPFVVSFDVMPKFELEEVSGEVNTNPPVKRSNEYLRYSL